MKRSKIIVILLSLALVVSISLGLALTSSAANWGFFSREDKDPGSYAYSMAIVGDTQSLVDSDVKNAGVAGYEPRLEKVYDWLVDNAESKKIEMVLGLGDITETWNEAVYPDAFKAEWELAVNEISKLNGKIPYTLVRGNHDTENGFNTYIGGLKGYTDQFSGDGAGFMKEGDYGTSYRKMNIGGNKWLFITLDWAPTGAELDWVGDVIEANSDHGVIITLHSYLYHDMTLDGEGDTADTAVQNPDWDDSIDPTSPDNDPNLVYNPAGMWERLVSKHSNIKMVISGHIVNSRVVYSQVQGDNGNTVTQMLVDPQGMDLDKNNEGGCGMVCMLYFNEDGTLANTSEWDGKNVDVEWYSTIKNQYYKDENQFSLNLELYDGGLATEKYGVIPAEYLDADKYPFVTFGYDDDIDEFFFHNANAHWTTSEIEGVYPSLLRFSTKKTPAYVLLRRDFNASEAGDVRYKSFGNMTLDVNLDLGGHTFTSSVYVFDANLSSAVSTTINVYGDDGSAFVVGGSQPLFWLGTNKTDAAGAEFTYNFDGIKFGYADGATAKNMLAATFSASGSSSAVTTQNINFNNCIFDLTNKPSGTVTLFGLNETEGAAYSVQTANVSINGGSIVANGTSDITLYAANSTDKVVFADGKSGALTLTVPADSESPAYTCYDENGKALSFELASEGETVDTYTLAEKKAGYKGEIDLWLIAGQSNAVGYGNDTLTAAVNDSRYSTGFENVLFYGNYESNWCPDTFIPVKMGLGKQGAVTTTVGAEIGMASQLANSSGMNAIIKRAWGASYLYPNTAHNVSQTYGTWTSPTYIANHNVNTDNNKIGELYNTFIETVAYGVEMLVAEGYTPVIRGMWWMQGEAETGTQVYAASYEELLTALITDVRRDLGNITGEDLSDMPFVMGKITRNQTKDATTGEYIYSQPTYLDVVNAAQTSVTSSVANTFIVDTTGLRQLDGWHYSADGQHYIGEQFIKTVIASEGKYSVTLDGANVTLSGGGAKSAGETVTVTIKANAGCVINSVKYVTGNGESFEIELDADGTYTFVMPDTSVVFEVSATDPGAVETDYGVIPSMYASGSEYPFIIFMDGKMLGAYTNWVDTAAASTSFIYGKDAAGKELQILLRANYSVQSASGMSFAWIGGTLMLDLDGNTLTSGDAQIFNALSKATDGAIHDSKFIIKNGRIEMKGGPAVAFNNVSDESYNARKNFYFTFDKVIFGLAEGYETWHGLVVDCYDNGTVGCNGYITLNDCKIDLKTVEPTKALNIFDLSDTSNKNNIYVTVKGGSFEVSDSFDTYVSIYAANPKNSFGEEKVVFEKDASGNYTVFNSDTALGFRALKSDDGKNLELVLTAGSAYSYTLAEIPESRVTEYGVIDGAFASAQDYPFAVFQTGSFYKAYKTYYEFLTDIKTNPLTVESVLYLRRDYKVDTSSGDTKTSNNDRNLNCLKAHLTIDLNDKVLTKGNLHTLQIMGNGKDISITVKNGTLHTANGTMIPFNNTGSSSYKETVNYVFENVNFTTAAGLTKPFVDAYTGGTDAGTTVKMTFTDCVFDITGLATASDSTYLFDLNEVDTNKIDFNVTINGGVFKAQSLSKIGFATYNDEREAGKGSPDKITFAAYLGEEFRLELPSGVSTISKNVDTTEGLLYFVEHSDNGTASISYLRSLETKYGTISTSNISALDYPFVFFQNGEFVAAYGTWYKFLSAAASLDWSKDSTLLLRRDYSTTECGKNSSALYTVGELTIDLGGNTFTRGSYHMFQAIRMSDNASHTDITVINGTICGEKNWSVPIAFNTNTATKESDVRFDFTFDNVTFTSTESFLGRLVAEAYSGGSFGTKNKLVFNNCTFDIISSGVEKLFQLNESNGSNKFDVSVEIYGGKVIDRNAEATVFATLSDARDGVYPDSIKFGKYNGEHIVFVYTQNIAAVVLSYEDLSGAPVSLGKIGSEPYATYQIGNDVYTKYGYIPFAYADEQAYPFAVFVNGKFGAAFDCWADTNGTNSTLYYANGKTATVLLRRDYTAETGSGNDSFNNFSHIANITLDLGGNTYTGASRAVFQAQAKNTGNAGVIDTYVYVINGKFLVDKMPVVQFNHANFETYNRAENFYFTFTDVEFGFVNGATATGLVCNTVEYNTTGEIGCLPHVVLNNCLIYAKAGTPIFDLNDSKDLVNGTVTVNGGAIIAHSFGTADLFAGSANDNIIFAKAENGNYTALTLPVGVEAPTAEFNGLVFVKVSENGETVTYRLRPTAVAELDFVPKMSLTLDRDLILNVYVPAKAFLNSFSLDGVEYADLAALEKVTVGEEDYYLVSISLDAKSAARDVVLRANVTLGEKSAVGTFKFGIIKYAEKILADGSDVEKTLVRDVLSYVRAAYAYFKTEDADTVSRINAILGADYDASNAPAIEGSANATTSGLKSATFSLDGTPAMRFYLADGADASKYAFFIDGTRVKTETSADGTYIDIDVYAYALCETVTYTIDGVESGNFHIGAYYEWSKTQNNENLVNLVARFWKYLQSARAYRDSVVKG